MPWRVAIREASAAGDLGDLAPVSGVDEDAVVEEGGLLLLLLLRHLQRERRSGIRAKKVAHVLARGLALECQVCGFDFARTYGPRGEGYIECHHIVPLHVAGARTTRLADLILICANCHRMIHRGSPWLTPDQLREYLTHQSRPVRLQ
jgi:5-methylcytosine-specific restriction protein A